VTYVLSSRQTAEATPEGGRLHVEGLANPRPLVEQLPAALQEDDFCCRFVAALDEVVAPLFATLDCFDSYLDPALAPEDFVDWLASWVGIEVDETWPADRRRTLVDNAVVLYRIRGTAPGLAAHLRLYSGATPEIEESGGCVWSQAAGTPFPGQPRPHLTVRLQVAGDEGVRLSTVSRIVAASRPAHVPYVVELISGGETQQAGEELGTDPGAGAADAPGAVELPGSESIELSAPTPIGEERPEDGDDQSPPD
jgi:phage tail-like protein